MKNLLFITILRNVIFTTNAQSSSLNIDPKWENYYIQNPSRIINNYQSSDFIEIIDLVHFIPQSNTFRQDATFFKKLLLRLDNDDLRQLMITGKWSSRTYKHDDYFVLYNLTYTKINKDTWDKYCPYLLPLMDLDQTINLH